MTDAAAPETDIPQARAMTQDGPPLRLWMIDASAYIFRAYHALPPLTRKSDGLPVGAVRNIYFNVDGIILICSGFQIVYRHPSRC